MGSGRPQRANHHTWLTSVLPYVEQSMVLDQHALEPPRLGAADCRHADAVPRLSVRRRLHFAAGDARHRFHYLCRQRGIPLVADGPNCRTTGAARGSRLATTAVCSPSRGICRWGSITDGTSNTVMVCEANSFGYKWGGFRTSGTGVPRMRNEAVFRSAFVATGIYGACCEVGKYSEVDDSRTKTASWFRSVPYSFTPTFLTAWGPNVEWPGASSMHPGIVQAGMADGSVRKVKDNLSWRTWCIINGVSDGGPAIGSLLDPTRLRLFSPALIVDLESPPMRRTWLLSIAWIVMAGCSDRPDPRQREGFVDTANDPGKVLETMESPDGSDGNEPAPAP